MDNLLNLGLLVHQDKKAYIYLEFDTSTETWEIEIVAPASRQKGIIDSNADLAVLLQRAAEHFGIS